ncbi:MAG: hypothetical protein RLY20_803 [Verrucomicrobiota bacterium]|jgi:hypothetical protein
MSDIQLVTASLERAAQRLRLSRALRGLWAGLVIGVAAWLLALLVFKLAPIPPQTVNIAALVGLACPLLGAIIGGWRKPSAAATARWVDVKQNLKERMSTALEVANTKADPLWSQLVVHDAASHAKEIDPRSLVPLHLTRAAHWAVLLLAVAFGLGFVPEYRTEAQKKRAADKEIIKDVGRGMAEVTKHEMAQRPLAAEPVKKSLEQVAALADAFQKAELTRAEALKDIASVQDKIKDQLKELGKDPAMKKLDQSQRVNGANQPSGAELQKQMEALQKQMGDNKDANPEKAEKLKEKLEKLQDAARAMADKNNPGDAAAKKELSQSLAALSKEAAEMGLNLPDLDKAIEALAANQVDKLLKDLDAATTDVEKMKQLAQQMQSLSQQMEKLGKNLGEQLDKGQADIAQSTIEKMKKALESGKVSPEQLQKMLEEVSKAIDPAKPYGECSKSLSKAADQMKSGDKAGAAKSLADAAKELEDLMQQFGDAQSLASAMDALKDASMCVGSGQCWGLGRCQGKSGFKPGGKPGKGVGTWADENQGGSLADVPMSDELVDNSDVMRPDQDPRGQTERDASLNSALTPTKVKGQFSKGDRMPSISLPGVSIKGTSKIQFEEAATAAQTDASSALSQDKVPRNYQGPVKDYFDDLKK